MQSMSSYVPLVLVPEHFASSLKEILTRKDLSNEVENVLKDCLSKLADNENRLPFEFVRKVATSIEDLPEKGDHHHLCDLLKNSEIILPEPLIIPRNPQLDARLEQLRKQFQSEEYVEMTKNVDNSYRMKHVNEFRSEVQELRSQLIAVVNFIITVAACFLFGYKAVQYTIGTSNVAVEVLAGIIVASFGAVADLYFLARKMDNTSP